MTNTNKSDAKPTPKAPAAPVTPAKNMIGKNFSLNELTVTKTGLKNEPNESQLAALKLLVENVLQPIRDHFNKPITINSAFRSPEVNAESGGAVNSQHLLGRAADIEIPDIRNEDIWHFIVDPKNKIPFDQCIAEHLNATDGSKGWIHVSYSAVQTRKEAFSIIKLGGRNVNRPGLVFEA